MFRSVTHGIRMFRSGTPGIVCISVLALALFTAPVQPSEMYRCPSGLTGTMYTYLDQCYRYVHSAVTWDVANTDCSSSNGGHLVVILDQATQNFISSLPFPSDAYQIWIGFTDKTQEQAWKWVTGDTWSYTAWFEYPLCFGDDQACPEDCASLWTSDGLWRDDHCNSAHVKYQYICQYNMGPTTTSTTTTPSPTSSTATPSPTPSTATPSPTSSTATPSPTPSTAAPSPTTVKTTTNKPVTSKATSSSNATTTTLPVTTKVTTKVTTSPLQTTTKPASSSVTTAAITSTASSTTVEPIVGGMGQLSDARAALSQGGLIGLVLALILVLLLIAFILLVIVRKRNRRKRYEADDFQVRFQNQTYDTNRPPSSYQTGVCNNSQLYATSNIYETPGPPKPCNGESSYYNVNGYEKPTNRDTLDKGEQENHYDSVKECGMVDLPELDDMSYKQSEYLGNGSGAGLHECSVRSEMSDPSYLSPQPQKRESDEVQSNRSNEELVKCFEEYSKPPSAYDNNLYVKDGNIFK